MVETASAAQQRSWRSTATTATVGIIPIAIISAAAIVVSTGRIAADSLGPHQRPKRIGGRGRRARPGAARPPH
eukprot:2245249-Prymnesium_polylepis.1